MTARGVRRLALFTDDHDYRDYVALLERAAGRFGWAVLGFALLPNHVHLVIKLERESLSKGMHWLHFLHARRFNLRHGYQGHAFDARFHARAIESEPHLYRALRYVALNPVVAGLCGDPAEWKWSSFAAVAGERDEHPFLAVGRVRALYGSTPKRGACEFAAAIRLSITDEMVT